MRTTFKLLMGAAFGLCLLSAAPLARAQDDVSNQIIPSVEYDSADIREALRAIFRTVNVSFTIDPDVQGTVNASLKDQPFATVLQNLLRQVDATYQVQGGVYRVMRVPVDNNTFNTGDASVGEVKAQKSIRRIKIRFADPQFVAAMIGAQAGTQDFTLSPELTLSLRSQGGNSGGMGGGMSGGMGGGMGGGMSGGMGGGMSGGMGGGMSGGMGGGMGGGFR